MRGGRVEEEGRRGRKNKEKTSSSNNNQKNLGKFKILTGNHFEK